MAFDPQKYLIQLPRKVKDRVTGTYCTVYDDYLKVRWRVVMFREQYPHGRITTEEILVDLERGYARYRAVVEDGEGGVATGYGTETKADFTDYAERAETRAIGRALALAGFGTSFVGQDLTEGEHVADSPVAPAQTTNDHLPPPTTATPPPQSSAAAEHGRPSEPVTPAPLPEGEHPAQGSIEVHPTADEISTLVESARAANVDMTSFAHDMRRLMYLPPTQKITKKFLRETMTMAQFRTADTHYRDALGKILEEDVPDHPPPGANGQPAVTTLHGQESSPAEAPVTAAVTGVTVSTPAEDPNAAAKAQLKAEVAGWGLGISEQEVDYIIARYPPDKAKALLEGHRDRAAKTATAAD